MRDEGRWILLAVAGVWLVIAALGTAADADNASRISSSDDASLRVIPLQPSISNDTDRSKITFEQAGKNDLPAKELDPKSLPEAKKKLPADSKAKLDSKYQKASKDAEPTAEPVSSTDPNEERSTKQPGEANIIAEPSGNLSDTRIPLLLHGEPFPGSTNSNEAPVAESALKQPDKKITIEEPHEKLTSLQIPQLLLHAEAPMGSTVPVAESASEHPDKKITIEELMGSTVPVAESASEHPDEKITIEEPMGSTVPVAASSSELPDKQNTIEEPSVESHGNLSIPRIPLRLQGEPSTGSANPDAEHSHSVPGAETTEANPMGFRMTEPSPESRGRSLNISAPEPTNTLHGNLTDLSDVSMDEEDKDVEGGEYLAAHNGTRMNVSGTLLTTMSCVEGNRTYGLGEEVTRGCEEKCRCGEDGKVEGCKPLCASPFVRAGRGVHDPLCEERLIAEEPCCVIMVCAEDSEPEPDETCVFGNKTVARGEKVEDGCSKVCLCEAQGVLKCQPRCPPNDLTPSANQHDRCVALSDPKDACCTITLCDVTLGDHEIKAEASTELSVNLTDIKTLNSTAVKLKFSTDAPQEVTVELSDDSLVWRQQKLSKDGILSNLEPSRTYYIRVNEAGRPGPSSQIVMPAEVTKVTANVTEKFEKNMCNHRGQFHKIGTQWYDECISLCICGEGAKTECATIECPTDFGLDVLDPHCLDWETVPANFEPKAPQCCPQEVRCKNNGSCFYKGQTFDNWSNLPSNVTGCDKKCYCEMGNVSCSAACPPVMALPPPTLKCPPHQASLKHLPGDDCCLHWVCGAPGPASTGKNATAAFPGPLATDPVDQLLIDDSKRPTNATGKPRPTQEPDKAHSFPREDPEDSTSYHPDGLFHYPMDPGHPTSPYNGPYNPDFHPTQPTVEEVFHLQPQFEKTAPPLKDKNKYKPDTKKPLDPLNKAQKEVIEQQQYTPPRPSTNGNNPHSPAPMNPNKLPQSQKGPIFPPSPNDDSSRPAFLFPPSPHSGTPYEDPQAGPFVVRPDLQDPNFVVPVSPKKKTNMADPYFNEHKSRPLPPVHPGKPIPGRGNPGDDILPEELYHLISSQHPGLVGLNQGPAQGHPGLYNIHQQLSNQNNAVNNQIQAGFLGPQALGPKKSPKPQIFAHEGPNGETTYHIHAPEIPNSPQQIEELLAHISQQDSNPGPFQRYPGRPPIPHELTHGNPPPLPTNVDVHLPQNPGLTHLNHPFAAQTPDQSGMEHGLPPGFPIPGGFPGIGQGPVQSSSDEVTVQSLEALDEHTVRLVFTVPPVLVGLHGRVELRYTNDKTNFDSSTWKSQVFATPDDLIATPQMEFELGDLKPSSDYKVKITVKLRDLDNSPTSKVYSVRTLEKLVEETTLPPQIPVDAELRLAGSNSTWVNVMWKKFTEYELQFIDGVQLRYKEHEGQVYSATPLIHRAVTSYIIEKLKPMTTYEVGIYFIPFPGQATELISEKMIQVTTALELDPYPFNVTVEVKSRKSSEVEVSWSGVPYPEDKYVNIYRAIYQSDSGIETTSTFKIAKRDSPAKTTITDLKPGTRYRLWIEVYLTNGRIKKSNVINFMTKPGVPLVAGFSEQGKLASIPLHEGDYYGPLVIVAIVASLAILSTLILLMMLMKRRTSSKADISPRKNTAAYDNPSYKTCEDAVTITNGRNKNSEHEMATINQNTDAKETT